MVRSATIMLRVATGRGNGAHLGLVLALALSAVGRPALAVELTLSVEPSSFVLGERDSARIFIEATGAGVEAVRGVRIDATVGRVGPTRREGPGRWSAVFRPPGARHPQTALLLARTVGSGPTAFAATTISMEGRTTIAIRTDRGARVTITVGGRDFGPVAAGRGGIARVEVVIPPGARTARALVVDNLGNANEREIELDVPDAPSALLSSPDRLVAGVDALVAGFAIDAAGRPRQGLGLELSRGEVVEHEVVGPLTVFTIRAPTRVDNGAVRLTLDAGPDRAEATIPVVANAANRVVITTDRDALVPGTSQVVTVHAMVVDRFGNIRPASRPRLWVSGQRIGTEDADEGGTMAVIPAPPAEVGLGTMLVEARAEGLHASTRVRLVGGPASLARLVVPEQAVADGRTAVPLRILLTGETGLPASDVPNIRLSSGELRDLRRQADGWWQGEWVPGRAGLTGPDSAIIEVARGSASARARVRLTAPVPWLTLALLPGLRTNAGALVGPLGRLELAGRVGLRRGWIELAVHTGLYYSRLEATMARGLAELRLWQVPLSAGIGYGLNIRGRIGVTFSTRGGAVLLTVDERTSFQPDSRRLLIAPMVEGAGEVMIGLGPGELVTRVGFGYAVAPEGSGLSGNLLGIMILVGYRLFLL